MMDKDLRPTKIEKIVCKCGELMVKIYPWSSFRLEEGADIPNCRKCIQKYRKDVLSREEKVRRARQIAASRKKIPF